mgnify:CR=1 FL=1
MENLRPLIQLHVIVFIFGFTGILGDLIDMDALSLVINRMSLAMATLALYFAWKKTPIWAHPKKLIQILGVGGIIAAHWVTFFHAIKISNVSVTLSCLASTSFMVALIEPLIYRRKIRLYEIGLGLLVVSGLYLIFRFEGDYTEGIIVALISAFLAAVFSVLNGKLQERNPAERIAFFEMLGGVIVVGVYFAFAGKMPDLMHHLPMDDLGYLFLLGTLCTAYPMVEIVRLLKHLTPYSISLAINMEPVYGIILAVLLLGSDEKMTPAFYIGTAVILAALFVDAIIKRRRRKKLKASLAKNNLTQV